MRQNEGEVDDAGHGGLLPAVGGHDLLLHMAVQDTEAENRYPPTPLSQCLSWVLSCPNGPSLSSEASSVQTAEEDMCPRFPQPVPLPHPVAPLKAALAKVSLSTFSPDAGPDEATVVLNDS